MLLHAVAEPNRLRLLHVLLETPSTVTQLVEATALGQGLVSHHVAVLLRAELISGGGTNRPLRVRPDVLLDLASHLGDLAQSALRAPNRYSVC